MAFFALLFVNPLAAIVWIVFAALAGYATFDFLAKHWIAALAAFLSWVLVSLILREIPLPAPRDRPRLRAFTFGFAATLIAFVVLSGALGQWEHRHHWEGHIGIAVSLVGGLAFAFFRRPRHTLAVG
ncbi:MAG: hypothetical protein H6872_05880 [Methylobacteriaceae bacterium]|nr:hypothetical protein [Methylobacteriaceae bacterium]